MTVQLIALDLGLLGDLSPIQSTKVKANIMRFAFIPKAQYTIGQVIQVQGRPMRVESYTHTGKNVVVHTLENAPKFERVVCVCTDSPAIQGVTA